MYTPPSFDAVPEPLGEESVVLVGGEVGYREMCDEGQRLEREGRTAAARALYESALQRPDVGVGGPSASTLLRWIARTWQAEANYDNALISLESAYAAAEQEGDERAIGHALNLHAIVRWRLGQLDEARRLYLEARELAVRQGDPLLAAMTAQNLGVIASIQGAHDQALRYYEGALREYRHLEMHRDECIALNNLAMLQTRLGRWEEAEQSCRAGLELADRYLYNDVQVQLAVNLAALSVARGDYTTADAQVNTALANARVREDHNAIAEALKLAGTVARVGRRFDEAEAFFTEAAAIASERRNVLLEAELYREQAMLYRANGRNLELLRALNQAHRLFGELKAQHDMADVERSRRELEGEFIDVARRWGESTESKDRYTQGHCERVSDVACAIARKAGLDETSIFWFRIGTLLHDVGKLEIPEEILNKPGRLTAEEWEIVKRHPVAGVELLSGIQFPWDITPIVRSHHEYWDGSGYPDGLAGEEIPLVARIVCLADVYDALTSERSYKKALPHAQAMELMRLDIGRQFDADLFAAFESVMAERAPEEQSPRDDAPPERTEVPTTDELTGLLLRRAFTEEAASLLRSGAEQGGVTWTLAVIDVDSFKSVNDTFGHLQGDDVLREVARILREGIRDFDIAGRYAGDEFVLLLRADIREAAVVAERLRESVARQQIPVRGSEENVVTVSLSLGLSCAPAHGETFEELFAAADRALYDAKRRGRNLVALAGGDAPAGKPKLDLDRFVGRAEEVARLVTQFEAALRGDPRVLAVIGEAGVGKTTLVRRIMPEVRLRTGIIVFGRSQEADVRPPYGPWIDVIAGLHGMGVIPARQWPELERLVPRLRLAGSATSVSGPGSKYALLEEIVEFFRLAASQRPLVIVLDDMHWGDTASWDVVEHLVTQLEQERILLCLTIRREDADRVEANRRRLSRNERYHEIQLPRLAPDDVAAWVESTLHVPSAESELPHALYRYTEGNPLFVKQVMQAFFDEGVLWHNGAAWEWRDVERFALPTAVDDLLTRRVTRLSPSGTRLLAVAAVFGRTFDIDEVALAARVSDDDLLDAIDEGLSAGVIESINPQNAKLYGFVHGLLTDVLKRGINPRRLELLQVRVAEALEQHRPHALSEIATLYDLGGDRARAYSTALKAGERAASVYALDDAMRVYRIAVRSATTDGDRLLAKERLLRIAQVAGRYAEAEELCTDLANEASVLDVKDLRLTAERIRLEVRAMRGEAPMATLLGMRALLEDAQGLEARREEIVLLTMISDLYARQGDWVSAQRLATEAQRVATTWSEDAELHADTTIRLGTSHLDTSPAEALAAFRDAANMYAASGNRFGQVRCLINSGIAHQRLGAAGEAEKSYREALDMAASARIVDLHGLAALNLGVLLTRAGRYDGAEASYQTAMRAFKKVKNEPRRLATLYNLAHLAHEQGDAAKAHDLAQAAADLASELGIEHVRVAAQARVGLAAIALGTEAEVDQIAQRLQVYREHNRGWFPGRESLEAFSARCALHAGHVEEAALIFREAASALQADPYDSAWLVAECATLFRLSTDVGLQRYLTRAVEASQRLGYLPLARRLVSIQRNLPQPQIAISS